MRQTNNTLVYWVLVHDRLAPFQRYVLSWYERYGRHTLPWRQTTEPYHILVSEMMLQQTQVERVIPKYISFLKRFQSVHDLAAADIQQVFTLWQGLGYNRRARFLQLAAQAVIKNHGGIFPKKVEELQALPGIGPYTANAIMAFAYNKRVTMIETNIRTVFLYHFFATKTQKVADRELIPLIEACVHTAEPRVWYAALMDYGSHLKRVVQNPSQRSLSYSKQSAFKGSNREVRGAILRILTSGKKYSIAQLQECVELDIERSLDINQFKSILARLEAENMIRAQNAKFFL